MDIDANMPKLSKLTKLQLDKMLSETQAELSRRESLAKAEKEIKAILKKYSINIGDIDLSALRSSANSSRKGKAGANKKAKGSTVTAKFKSPDGSETWTGRGRPPKWAVSLCEREGMSVKAFKEDARFIIT